MKLRNLKTGRIIYKDNALTWKDTVKNAIDKNIDLTNALRMNSSLKMNQIALVFNISPGYISQIKNGSRKITYFMATALNSYFPSKSVEEWREVSFDEYMFSVEQMINLEIAE